MEANSLTILAIDDHQDNLTTLKAVVADAFPGARVLTAMSGLEGIELALTQDPDVILLDIVMPGMDGFEVCRRLKKDKGLRHIPVVFLTALNTDSDSRIRALETGAEAFLSKPIEEAELTAQIRAMAKIKAAGAAQRQEKGRLETLVAERTFKLNQELTDRPKAQEALLESENKFKSCAEQALAGIYIIQDGVFKYVNSQFAQMFGYTVEEILKNMPFKSLVYAEDLATVEEQIGKRTSGEAESVHYTFMGLKKNGRIFPVEIFGATSLYKGKPAATGTILDITERKHAEDDLRVSVRFLEIVHAHTETAPLLREYVSEIKSYTGCDAVGIRVLDENLNIPYEAYQGFSRKFFEAENRLSLKTHECMCTRVIRGDVNPGLPFFTERGGFYLNATSRFLANVSEDEKGRTRNKCNEEGYETVGLFPFRSGGKTLGLIHVADRRENMLPPNVVRMLEKAALQLGTAFQRALTESKLRESEEFKNAILDSMASHIAVLDRNGVVVAVNEPWVRFSTENSNMEGLPAHHSGIGVNYLEVCLGSRGESSEKAIAAHDGILAVLEGKLPSFSLEYPCHSQTIERWFTMTVTPLGSVERGVVISHTSITERKQAEEFARLRLALFEFSASHSLEELLQKTLDEVCALTGSLIGFFHLVENDQKTLSLQTWSTRTVKEFCKARGIELHYPVDHAGVWVDCIRERRPVIHNDYPALPHRKGMPEGHAVVMRELVVPIMRSGRTLAILGIGNKPANYTENDLKIVHDLADVVWEIVERKRMEDELRESEARLRQIIDLVPHRIFVKDSDGKYLLVNKAVAESYNRNAGDLTGKYHADFHRDESELRNMLQDDLEVITKGITKFIPEESCTDTQGNLHFFQTTKVPIHISGNKTPAVLGVAIDITERKRAEEAKEKLEAQLRQSQKVEALGVIAGGIAHDFNNILQPIIGYTEIALNKLSPSDPMRRGLEQVLSSSLRAKELIRQILAVSRSTQEQQRIPTDISSIIKEALKLLRSTLPTSIEMRQKIRSGLAMADPTQIHQVLMNLCTNAAHAMGDSGILEVRLSPVDLSESDLADQSIFDLRSGPYLRLTVSDTGCGMDVKTMERIFDPYFTTKEVGKGTGLGLAVVSGIVKRHEGSITVRSEPEKGATFTIYIPKVNGEPGATIKVENLLLQGSERILLVDDEPALIEMATILLEGLGYKVTSRTDSLNALEVFRSSPDEFDLVITDYAMPKLTGLDFAGEVLRIRPDMPVLLCTGFNEKITSDIAKDLGIGLLMKPYGIRQISEMVRTILGERKGG